MWSKAGKSKQQVGRLGSGQQEAKLVKRRHFREERALVGRDKSRFACEEDSLPSPQGRWLEQQGEEAS